VYWKNPHSGKTEEEAYASEQEARKAHSLIRHRLKFERDTFRWADTPERPAAGALDACYALYLQEKAFSAESLKWNITAMRPCLRVIGGMGVRDITRAHLEAVKSALAGAGIKPVTVRARLSVLRTVLRWCAYKGIIEQCPPFPKLPPPHYEHFIPPTPDEIALLCRIAPPHLVRVIILGTQLGIRIGPSELLKLKWTDIDLARGTARIIAARKRPAQPMREVPLRASLHAAMREWATTDAALGVEYVVSFQGRKVRSIHTAWRTALRKAGIKRRIRPYDLRHAFASEAIAAGVDVGTVARLMGHDPKMLLVHYQHVADRQKRAAVEALPDIPIQFTAKALRQGGITKDLS
jgi:integrase